MNEQPTVVSLFAGCGGSSLGYKMAGFRELLANDWDQNSKDTFELNFPGIPYMLSDITTTDPAEMMRIANVKRGELDVLDGSPPCQGFSTSGKRNMDDPRNRLFEHYAKVLRAFHPRTFVMENVAGMTTGKMRGVYFEVIKALKAEGYSVNSRVLNAANYGVPQSRQRLFVVGIRDDIAKAFIFPPHVGRPITALEALEGLQDIGPEVTPSSRIAELSLMIPPGKRLADVHPKKHGYNLVRLHPNRPCRTVTKMFSPSMFAGILHWKGNRYLTINELKRLSSFPDDFQFTGKFEEQWARIGNAVMPLQMKAIATELRKQIFQ